MTSLCPSEHVEDLCLPPMPPLDDIDPDSIPKNPSTSKKANQAHLSRAAYLLQQAQRVLKQQAEEARDSRKCKSPELQARVKLLDSLQEASSNLQSLQVKCAPKWQPSQNKWIWHPVNSQDEQTFQKLVELEAEYKANQESIDHEYEEISKRLSEAHHFETACALPKIGRFRSVRKMVSASRIRQVLWNWLADRVPEMRGTSEAALSYKSLYADDLLIVFKHWMMVQNRDTPLESIKVPGDLHTLLKITKARPPRKSAKPLAQQEDDSDSESDSNNSCDSVNNE